MGGAYEDYLCDTKHLSFVNISAHQPDLRHTPYICVQLQHRRLLTKLIYRVTKKGETLPSPSPKSKGFRLFHSNSGNGGVGGSGAPAPDSWGQGGSTNKQDTGTGTTAQQAIMSKVGER